MALILVTQVALPLALNGWLAILPAKSLAGFVAQAAGTGALLFGLARVAQWALPVWWLPLVYGALWFAARLARLLRHSLSDLPLYAQTSLAWAGNALAIVLLALGGHCGAKALAGQRLPPLEILDIANQFGPGRYLVGHGDPNTLVNSHLRTLDQTVDRFRPWPGQSHAADFFGLGTLGLRARGWRPADPAVYAIFGAELRAPCAGSIVAAVGAMPDFDVPSKDSENRLGNHVILRWGNTEIVLAHMRQDSVAVTPGDTVAVWDRLGEVGNSGA
ncbi:M23 family metallopeptidase [Jannaschia pohangensis]|nr:M23 family metallopeptidase [Jannaschia pohangensis]